MQSLVLTWGSPHSFRLVENQGELRGTLMIRMRGGNQTIDVPLARVSLSQIETSFAAQKNHWKHLYVKQGNPYIAVRVIRLPGRKCIVWYLYHENDSPADSCVLLENVEDEKDILALYIDPPMPH